jgi:hypothetical protein
MDEARVNTLMTEIQTFQDEMFNCRPEDAHLDYLMSRFIGWSFRSTELLNLRLTDLAERVSRIEASLNLPGPADRTESPPAQP